MSTRRPDPLTPEERELAERLAWIGPSGVRCSRRQMV